MQFGRPKISIDKKLVLKTLHYNKEFIGRCFIDKQSWQMMESRNLMFQAKDSQLEVEKSNLTRLLTRKCHLRKPKACLKIYRYRKTDIQRYLKQTILSNWTALEKHIESKMTSLACQKEKRRWSWQKNRYSQKYIWRWWNQESACFVSNWICHCFHCFSWAEDFSVR